MTTKTPSNPSARTTATIVPERVAPPAPLGPNTEGITVGIDLGDKKHAICVIDAAGETIDARKISNHRESLRRLSKKFPTARMVMEVGSHSPWISRFFSNLEHEVAKQARANLTDKESARPDLLAMIEPSLLVIDTMTDQIKALDRNIEKLGREHYLTTLLLRQIPGVGPITALAFVLIIGDPDRFASSRDIGAYFGLVPKRDQSGDLDKQLRISKAGNSYMRQLLVGAAQYILGPFGPDSDLRRSGLKLADRGGRAAKKKAVVATARKLGVLMHTMWVRQSDYIAVRSIAEAEAARAAAIAAELETEEAAA